MRLALPGVTPEAIAAGRAVRVVNASSKNFGVIVRDAADREFVDYLIRRNAAVPAEQEQEYGTYAAGQETVQIRVVEADGAEPPADPTDPACRTIKEVSLHLPPGLPAGHPIRVKYGLSDDGGRLRVRASDPTSGRAIDETVEAFDALMPQEVADLRARTAAIRVNR